MILDDTENRKAIFYWLKRCYEIRPLCISLRKMSAHRRDFDKTKCMPFLIKDE